MSETAGSLHPPPPGLNPADLPSELPPPSNPLPFANPPPNTMPTILQPPPADGQTVTNAEIHSRDSEDEGDSGSERDESDDEDGARWYHLDEDKSEPCADELEYIESRKEHSATDHSHWENTAFFELNDPELKPLDSGRMDFVIENFNGTKESPNNETIMRSPVFQVGGLDWQVKVYPRGAPGSDFVSVFLECVSMRSPDYKEHEDFICPPFPQMDMVKAFKPYSKIQKRRSAAAQICVVMYNPAEPRVYESQTDAHQYSKSNADWGWKYFTNLPKHEFHVRRHGQRRAILRGDKLAFSAYVRVIQDPTGCMWEHTAQCADEMTLITGLRPFSRSLVYTAATLPLLHFAPFRQWVQRLPYKNIEQSNVTTWLQSHLLKMYTRARSPNYGSRGTQHDVDVMEMLWRLTCNIQAEYADTGLPEQFTSIVGSFHSQNGAPVGSNRLNTKDHPSIQEAVDNHSKLITRPALLTLELQRQEHDKKQRKWKKLTNKVKCEEHITISGTAYTLFAFITHCGHLRSCRYNSYVRPRGPGKGWYAYQDSKVTRLTEKQARERHSGAEVDSSQPRSPEDGYDSPFSEFHEPNAEVTCAVMYVRDDTAAETFDSPDTEDWRPQIVEVLKETNTEIPKSATHEYFPGRPSDSDGHYATTEEEFARLRSIREAIDEAARRHTPDPVLMDGEDVVMRDADDDSNFEIEHQETSPQYDGTVASAGTKDWLGQAYYEGHFNFDGQFHGGGHLIATNGDEYLGQFRNSEYSGYGKLIYALTGEIYEGDFKHGLPDGRGKLTERSTGNVYEGGFKEGKKHGEFVLKGTVTSEDKSICHICYDKDITTAFYDCGHAVCCYQCASKVDLCPVCRRRVVSRLQLYGVRISTN